MLLFVFVSRRDAFAGVDEAEIQSFLYDSDGCYNSSLFQASSVSAMTTFENLLMTHTRNSGESFFEYEYLREFEAKIGTAREVV
jgi:hypothetical protein